MQTKLTTEQIGKLKQARNGITGGILWSRTNEGYDYWQQVIDGLDDKIKHGTTDGKPWVDPEPTIPEGWRKANPNEWTRRDVQYWHGGEGWVLRTLQGSCFDSCNTVYIVPIDQPLTDQDAKERPWVMVADERNRWISVPKILLSAPPASARYVVVDDVKDTVATSWEQARRATAAEIEAANGNS